MGCVLHVSVGHIFISHRYQVVFYSGFTLADWLHTAGKL